MGGWTEKKTVKKSMGGAGIEEGRERTEDGVGGRALREARSESNPDGDVTPWCRRMR